METKIVSINEYSNLAMRTAKIMSHTDMLVHGALGLCTEVGEFAEGMPTTKNPQPDKLYVAKELGDGFWFTNYIITALGMNFAGMCQFAQAMGYSSDSALADYAARAGAVGSRIKAFAFYSKPLETEKLQVELINVLNTLFKICNYMGFPPEAVLGLNIQKLQERYPEKYSDQDAIQRKDESAKVEDPVQSIGSVGAFDPVTTLQNQAVVNAVYQDSISTSSYDSGSSSSSCDSSSSSSSHDSSSSSSSCDSSSSSSSDF